MVRYALIIEYDGTAFQGWQIQPNGATVQSEIQKALAILFGTDTALTGSGRTDTGVHARFQVAHFDADHLVDTTRTYKSLNGLLPNTIAIRDVVRVDNEFHARYDAIRRCYRYHVGLKPTSLDRGYRLWIPSPIDIDRMQDACSVLLGEHDYSAFCKVKSETRNRVCNVSEAIWIDEGDSRFYFQISANRFLHGMVRTITGTLLEIGSGKRDRDSLSAVLASGDRTLAGPAVKPHGLVLHHVTYPDGALPCLS